MTKLLAGSLAIALLSACSAGVGLDPGPAAVRDLWTGEEFQHLDDGTIATRLRRPMPGHGVVMLRVTPAG